MGDPPTLNSLAAFVSGPYKDHPFSCPFSFTHPLPQWRCQRRMADGQIEFRIDIGVLLNVVDKWIFPLNGRKIHSWSWSARSIMLSREWWVFSLSAVCRIKHKCNFPLQIDGLMFRDSQTSIVKLLRLKTAFSCRMLALFLSKYRGAERSRMECSVQAWSQLV